MKNIFKILFAVILFLVGVTAFAELSLSQDDKAQIANSLDTLVQAVNAGDVSKISLLLSSSGQVLLPQMQDRIRGGVAYQLDYTSFDKRLEIIDANHIKVEAKFAASGVGWKASGLSTYFVFEKQDNQWLIADTDFYKKLGFDYVVGVLKWVFIIAGPIFLFMFIFWLWMLIDCLKREFKDKALWVVLLFVFNFIAALLYYFIIKRKNISNTTTPEFKAQ